MKGGEGESTGESMPAFVARQDERAAIVRYIRRTAPLDQIAHLLAGAIERGEHHSAPTTE